MPAVGLQSPAIACYGPAVSRDADIEAILEHGRRTRTPTPRWLWVVAAIVGGICVVGFAIALLGAGEPAHPAIA